MGGILGTCDTVYNLHSALKLLGLSTEGGEDGFGMLHVCEINEDYG
jgi:hypothetical protein